MALNSYFLWIVLLSPVIGTNAKSHFAILHLPPSLKFFGVSVKESHLKDIYCAALGFSTELTSDWKEMKFQVNPFDLPEAVVEVYVDGVSDVGLSDPNTKVYEMSDNNYEADETADHIAERVVELKEVNNKLVNIRLSDKYDVNKYTSIFGGHTSVFGEYTDRKFPNPTLQHLKNSVKEDFQFIHELQVLEAITAAVKGIKPDYKVDFFQFKFGSLRMLSARYGPQSEQMREAKETLKKHIRELNEEFVKTYNGDVLFTTVMTEGDKELKRDARAVSAIQNTSKAATAVLREGDPSTSSTTDSTTTTGSTATSAPKKSDDKADKKDEKASGENDVVFVHIFFWICFVWMFVVMSVVRAFMYMDPGRDSVVYRMTTTKL